jgi:hypothetical protein
VLVFALNLLNSPLCRDLLYDDEYGTVKTPGAALLASDDGLWVKQKLAIACKDKKCKPTITFETKISKAGEAKS